MTLESEKLIPQHNRALFQTSNCEAIHGVDKPEKQELIFIEDKKKGKKRRREAEDLFSNYNERKNPSPLEEKFRLTLLRFFIEYFCMNQKVPLKEIIGSIERTILVRTLSYFQGNQKKAAKFLGIKKTTLNEKIKKYNIRILKKIF